MLAQSPFAGPSPRPNRAKERRALHDISNPPATPGRNAVRSFGILSTFPPTSCGIATFSAALAAALIGHDVSVDVVRCGPTPDLEDPLVLASLADDGSPDSRLEVLNRTDVVIVQHEYGIYPGPDGESVVGLLDGIVGPIVVVAHTVVQRPDGQSTPGPRAGLRPSRRRGGDDRNGAHTAAGRVRRRRVEGGRDRPRSHHTSRRYPDTRADATARRRPTADTHLGPARSREGHRMGDRCHGRGRRPAAQAALRHRGHDAPEGARTLRGVVPRDARRAAPRLGARAASRSTTRTGICPRSWASFAAPTWSCSRTTPRSR